MDEEESLSEWLEKRERNRQERFRVEILAPGGSRGAHTQRDSPRIVSRWNGYGCEAVTVAANAREARQVMYPGPAPAPAGTEWDRAMGPPPDVQPLRPGRGQHRKP